MKEQKLQVFLDIIANYFNQFGAEELIIDTPYLLDNEQLTVHDYTGIIDISGIQKGVVYFTASYGLLSSTLDKMGETDKSEGNFIDLAGEVANTIAGNARKEFGANFHISVPVVFKGPLQNVILPDERSFIIPITWLSQSGEIVVCLYD